MFVADARRNRHGDDAAQYRSPEGINEGLVAGEEQDEFVAATRAQALQVMQNPQGALIELSERYAPLLVVTFQIRDAARGFAICLNELNKCRGGEHQRRSSLM